MMLAVAISGPMKSGKTTLARELARRLRAGYVSFGDFVRTYAGQLGLQKDRPTLQRIGQQLVEEDVEVFCRRVLDQSPAWARGGPLVIDGVRHVTVLKALRQFVSPMEVRLVYLSTSSSTRQERSRDFSDEPIFIHESHPVEAELQSLNEMADIVVSCEGPIGSLVEDLILRLMASA